MDIPLFSVEDMKSGRGGGKRGSGQKYSKYIDVLAPHVAGLIEAIQNSPHVNAAKQKFIAIKVDEIRKLGVTGKHETSVYWGTKYALFGDPEKFVDGVGIVVTTGQTKGGDPLLVMRMRTAADKLPPSLVKNLGGEVAAGKDAAEKAGVVADKGAGAGSDAGATADTDAANAATGSESGNDSTTQ